MKVALAQLNPKIGDVEGNVAKILAAITEARSRSAEAILFPELAVTGYPPRDLLDYANIVDENLSGLEKIRAQSQGILVITGFVERNTASFGKPFFNSVAVFNDGQEIHRYRKRLLPYYGIFEDERYFEAGSLPAAFHFHGKKYAIAICEDIWSSPGIIPRLHAVDPLRELESQSLAGLFCPSASPFDLQKPALRARLLKNIQHRLGCPVYYTNQVGANDEVLFDGGSTVVTDSGAHTAGAFTEEIFLEGDTSPEPPASEAAWLERALTTGIRDYVQKTGMKKVCLGLSGGIDSAVVAALAARALGPENVEGISLPSEYSSTETRQDAQLLAKNLGINFREISIQPAFEALRQSLKALKPQGVTLENLQPRLRMTLLMAVANEGGQLLLNTSNKSELATGYATLYGDSAGAIAVLGDVTKRQVYLLADEINSEKELIPRSTITRPPTAELKPGQKDEDTLPPYAELDELVVDSFEKKCGPEEWRKRFPDSGPRFQRLHRISEYKRRQFPPILRVSSRAIGAGRRIPVAARHYAD